MKVLRKHPRVFFNLFLVKLLNIANQKSYTMDQD